VDFLHEKGFLVAEHRDTYMDEVPKKDPWPEGIRGGAAKHDDIECCLTTFISFQEIELEWRPVISVTTELKARIW